MTAYTSRSAGQTESIERSERNGTRAVIMRHTATLREHMRHTAAASTQQPERPRLSWRTTEQGLRMSWASEASAG